MLNFLNLKTEAFGLDINGSVLKIVKLKKKRGFFELASYNDLAIKPGVIESGEIKDEDSLIKIIKNARNTVKGEKLDTKYIVASLPEEKSFLQVIQMPKMKEEELKSAVFFEAENYIPMPLDQVYLDFEVIEPVVDSLNHFDVLIVAMPKTVVDSYASCFKKVGLIPFVFEVESGAIARALVKDQTSNSPLVLIDVGENNICFTAFAGRSIRFTSSIPISSEQLAKTSLDKSQNILTELVGQVEKYLSFYQDHIFHEHLPQDMGSVKIILCGSGANLKGLLDFLSKKLKIPVELGNPWINIPSKKVDDVFHKKSLIFTTAIGLALRGADSRVNNYD